MDAVEHFTKVMPKRQSAVVAAVCDAVVRFGNVTVLDSVNLELVSGEVHALVGQNGAGKSTLVKALMGVNSLARGHIEIDGHEVSISGPQEARKHGLEIVYQDQPLAPHLDVAENMFLGREPLRGRTILDLAAMHRTGRDVLVRVGATCSPTDLVRDLTPTQRVQVSIAAALAANPRVLILDEPTAALGSAEAGPVFDLIRGATEAGVAVLYISHRLGEITSLAHRITILRDGRLVRSAEASELTTKDMIAAMVGRGLETLYPDTVRERTDVVLSAENVCSGSLVNGMNFEVHAGEIVGLAGLVGSGASETLLALFGAQHATGSIRIDGSDAKMRSPRAATRHGLALVPEERRTEAIFPGLSLSNNITAASLSKQSKFWTLRSSVEKRTSDQIVKKLGILAQSIDQDITTLSGGNQQKMVVGRWLVSGGRVYLVDEPTAGVDVGAKVEIYRQLGELASEGAAVLMVSSDFEELIGLCDRILVVHDGVVTGQYERGTVDVTRLTADAAAASAAVLDAEPHGAAPNSGVSRVHVRTRQPWLRRLGLPVAMILVIAVLGFGSPAFIQPSSLLDVLRMSGTPMLLAAALSIALGAGSFDLSVGATAQLSATLSAAMVIAGSSPLVALIVGLLVGTCVGIVNGGVTVLFKVPAFVASLGMLFLLVGINFELNGGLALAVPHTNPFLMLGRGYIGWIPVVTVISLAVIAVITIIWRRSRLGLRLRAIGDDAHTAEMRGAKVGLGRSTALVLSGAISGLAGVLMASYSSGATASDQSLVLLTTALAAAFLGSAMTRSFLFDPATAAIGSVFVVAVGAGLISNGLGDQWLSGVQGLVLLLAVLLAVFKRRELGQVAIF